MQRISTRSSRVIYARYMTNMPIPYMHRTRMYYRALGYPSDYRWAHNETAPFTHLKTPLSKAKQKGHAEIVRLLEARGA